MQVRVLYFALLRERLRRTEETLALRLLGRGKVRREAIAELTAMPTNPPIQRALLDLLWRWKRQTETKPAQSAEDKEFLMDTEETFSSFTARIRKESITEALLTVFAERGLLLSDAMREKIRTCKDAATLDRWLRRAITAPDAAAALSEA